jgi:hypothetical protein
MIKLKMTHLINFLCLIKYALINKVTVQRLLHVVMKTNVCTHYQQRVSSAGQSHETR